MKKGASSLKILELEGVVRGKFVKWRHVQGKSLNRGGEFRENP